MTRKDEVSPSHIDAKLNEFDTKLDRLYRRYEQYFIGVEKRPPHALRREVQRLYRELEQAPKLKTSLKFRFRSLTQRFNSYKTYWNRTERQIEEGTYHRDVARAKARKQRREQREKAREEAEEQAQASGQTEDGAFELDDLDLDLDLESLEEELEEMDQRGEFEKYVGTQKIRHEGFPEDEKPDGQKPGNSEPASRHEAARGDRRDGRRRRQGSSSWERPEVDESVKKKRLAELQAKLGLSTGKDSGSSSARPADSSGTGSAGSGSTGSGSTGSGSTGSGSTGTGGTNPFERSSEGPTKKARPENPSAPSRGADMSKLKKLRRAKERIEREQKKKRGKPQRASRDHTSGSKRRGTGSNRVIRRNSNRSGGSSSDASGGIGEEKSRKIYNSLVEAKRRCKEDTSNLNYDSFKRSMDRQRTQIRKKKGARDVDFKVVIKGGRAFLKPETKK